MEREGRRERERRTKTEIDGKRTTDKKRNG